MTKSQLSQRSSDARYRQKLAITHDRMIFTIPKPLKAKLVEKLSADKNYDSATQFLVAAVEQYVARKSRGSK